MTTGGGPEGVPRPGPNHTFGASLRIALQGAWDVLRTERNAQIEATIGLLAVLLGLLLRISPVEWAVLCGLIFTVLALEALNTAIEAAVDLITEDHHPLARRAKDAAAGAVVLLALGSLGVGAAIFLPRLWALLGGIMNDFPAKSLF
ncbi:MAG: diacylglycerol kinase family protein [Caldilineae bacterium]|nr:MAG: diacylglycerol kinase family protein [Caldilineae bacterium]